jgi:hypothetical protein
MKKFSWLIGLSALLIFTGCFDTEEEVTIKDNGSGIYASSMDMGKIIGMLKAFGGEEKEMKEIAQLKTDTLIFFKDIKDSLKNLNTAEKKIIAPGTLRVKIDAEDEQCSFIFSIPFSKTEEIGNIRSVLDKAKQDILRNGMKNKFPKKDGENKGLFGKEIDEDGDGEMGAEIDGYFTTVYGKDKLTRKVKKEKIANIEEDKSLTTLKEMSQMGMSMNMKTIINLPKPAKKAEGKGVKLSNDRKKVTIEGTLDDFFEDASYFEYEIEY